MGVGLFLVGGEQKDTPEHLQPLLVGNAGGDGITVPGLALPRESTHQVLPGLAVGKGLHIVGHKAPSSV